MQEKERSKHKKKWTQEDIELLREYWGVYSTPTIAKYLDRTTRAIINKATKIRLGRKIDNSEMISLSLLIKELGYANSHAHQANKMIKAGLKIHSKKATTRSIRMVLIDEFWLFAENNKNMFDFSRLEENIFGEEPDWVKSKRAEDYERNRKIKSHKCRWDEKETNELIRLLKEHRYTVDEIAKRLHRTESSIEHRVIVLGIKERPIKNEDHCMWSDNETQMLIQLVKQGKDIETISSTLKKSAKALQGKLHRLYSVTNLEKIREILREEQTDCATDCISEE